MTGWDSNRVKLVPHLHWVQAGDAIVLMDARRGEYFGLDPHTSNLWLRLVGSDAPVDEAGYGALSGLVEAARIQGWLVAPGQIDPDDRTSRPHAARAWRPFPVLDAYGCLVRAFVSLRYLGFAPTYRWAQLMGVSRCAQTGADFGASVLERALAAFSRAEHFVISRLGFEDCLPRSLALYVYLCRAGIPVRHQIGVRRYPFGAHAWVERGQVPLLARAESIVDFIPLATVGQ